MGVLRKSVDEICPPDFSTMGVEELDLRIQIVTMRIRTNLILNDLLEEERKYLVLLRHKALNPPATSNEPETVSSDAC